jgi:hypothetical protein
VQTENETLEGRMIERQLAADGRDADSFKACLLPTERDSSAVKRPPSPLWPMMRRSHMTTGGLLLSCSQMRIERSPGHHPTCITTLNDCDPVADGASIAEDGPQSGNQLQQEPLSGIAGRPLCCCKFLQRDCKLLSHALQTTTRLTSLLMSLNDSYKAR